MAKGTKSEDVTSTKSDGMSVFQPVAAPRVTSTSHAALVEWRKLRREYVQKVHDQCKGSPNETKALLRSVKSSFDDKLLTFMCDYRWGLDKKTITDEQIEAEIDKIIATVKNEDLPDIAGLFHRELRMNLSETDVMERVTQYFILCDSIIEDNGLTNCFEGADGQKEKCKLLRKCLMPEALRDDVEQVLCFQQKNAKHEARKLFKVITERALVQDREFQRQRRTRTVTKALKEEGPIQKKHRHQPKLAKRPTTEETPAETKSTGRRERPAAPATGCLKCKGNHWLSDCTVATEVEKMELSRNFKKGLIQKKGERKRFKRLQEMMPVDQGVILLAGEVSRFYCADTGSDYSIINPATAAEILRTDPDAAIMKLETPVVGLAVGGTQVTATHFVTAKCRLSTAAGPVEPVEPYRWLIVEDSSAEVIVGNDVLLSLGIDVNRQLEQLARRGTEDDHDEGEIEDVSPARSPEDQSELASAIEALIERAMVNGFPAEHRETLADIVERYDVWRVTLGRDPPAKVPAYRL